MSEQLDPTAAHARSQAGWQIVDVRSTREFAQGFPAGALNLPVFFMGPSGMRPNEDFLPAMRTRFALDERLILLCRSGQRSARACEMLRAAGFTQVADIPAGFEGPGGWLPTGLPVESDVSGVSWADVNG